MEWKRGRENWDDVWSKDTIEEKVCNPRSDRSNFREAARLCIEDSVSVTGVIPVGKLPEVPIVSGKSKVKEPEDHSVWSPPWTEGSVLLPRILARFFPVRSPVEILRRYRRNNVVCARRHSVIRGRQRRILPVTTEEAIGAERESHFESGAVSPGFRREVPD